MFPLSFLLLLMILSFPGTNSVTCGGSIECPVGTPCLDLDESVNITCTENSFCDDETEVCKCMPGFQATSYKLCLADHQSDCSIYACNEESQLVCNRSINPNGCQCALLGTHYSIPQGKCVGNAGTDCSKTFGCTDNAYCNNELDWKCYCKGGFSQTSQGRCLLGYDRICDSSVPEGDKEDYLYACNSDAFFRCDNETSKCVCEDETVYDEGLEECVSLVGGQCDFKITVEYTKVLKCVQGAVCTDNGIRGICRCINRGDTDEESKTCSRNNANAHKSSYFFLISPILITLLIWSSIINKNSIFIKP